jgi:hypothetical protein
MASVAGQFVCKLVQLVTFGLHVANGHVVSRRVPVRGKCRMHARSTQHLFLMELSFSQVLPKPGLPRKLKILSAPSLQV